MALGLVLPEYFGLLYEFSLNHPFRIINHPHFRQYIVLILIISLNKQRRDICYLEYFQDSVLNGVPDVFTPPVCDFATVLLIL
jgi:hypothetical protein